ncbi:Glu/Leu/Phe/Val family dehydrogenase [Limoniibacter endophyticus]|uniref:Leucine dehydrogenase n=1 Tax=Limoniibacter endophyticus TaxID=1565040 RepID=A0A8J3DQI1_9HYPH|nr:Glu/Leu/Phe/Val dehydrogenase [Limoniibacter endophyticus]GHC74026.1 leucine dehydrogenase [Limoniibacter endophyticus]
MSQAKPMRHVKIPGSEQTLELRDITELARENSAYDGHERLWMGKDTVRGLTAIVAIHDTTLGPALGGTRIWKYSSFDEALTDVLRLSRGMTLKNSVCGIPFGGGKAVIIADSKTEKNAQLLTAYADMLQALTGQYITAEDVGLTLSDADFLRLRTSNVAGTTIGGSENPSPFTALGVFLGLKAAWKFKTGRGDLKDVRVAVQGLGAVGLSLCRHLHQASAKLVVADMDQAKCEQAHSEFSAEIGNSANILLSDVDILAPCALGGVFSALNIDVLNAQIIAGAANNQLLTHTGANRLRDRGILYAPDYVLNAGGVINVAAEFDLDGYDRTKVLTMIDGIPATLTRIFERAEREGAATNDIAEIIARERIEAEKSR